jgi:hypothetical protein
MQDISSIGDEGIAGSGGPGRELEPAIRQIVRRVIRRGRATSPVAGNILALADKIARQAPAILRRDREQLIAHVCRQLMDSVAAETPRFASNSGGLMQTSGGYRPAGASST